MIIHLARSEKSTTEYSSRVIFTCSSRRSFLSETPSSSRLLRISSALSPAFLYKVFRSSAIGTLIHGVQVKKIRGRTNLTRTLLQSAKNRNSLHLRATPLPDYSTDRKVTKYTIWLCCRYRRSMCP